MIGARVGGYEILSLLGAGGMGEVYRARDTRLGRDVAIKVLPSFFASDSDRLARFAREAQLLAALNHPNIATIHGFEEATGVPALVMELVEGPTLAEKLAHGSGRTALAGLPLAEALSIGRQVAEALESAHEKGIVHRDLKPANLKLSHDGQIKVLDFGLAKAISCDGAGRESELPTIMTSTLGAGSIVGTPAYMSPEQARGQVVDTRTDIWAFGCVLFEMVTGRIAFSGRTIPDTIAAVLERQPDWSALPVATPANVRRVLMRCLEKDPKRRWRHIGDVRIELDDADTISSASSAHGPSEPKPSRWRERVAWGALVVVAAAVAAVLTPGLRKPPAPVEVRFDVSFPRDIAANFAQLAISPDGQQLVAAPNFGGTPAPLWLRPLGSTSGTTLPGTEGATFPFWSPDGKSIGFFADAKLKRIDIESQAIEIVADGPVARGGAWQADGTILFAPKASGPLFRVPATGGEPVAATHLDQGQNDHRAPFILPDGRHFHYYARGTPQARGVYVARLDGTEARRLLDADAAAVYAASGHLLFVRQGDLFAHPFDASRLALDGAAFRIASGVSVNPGVSLASLAASASGVIAYGTGSMRRTQFAWFDRSGKRLETVGPPDQTTIANPTLSPDGQQIALSRVVGGNWDIWLMNMEGAMNRLTSKLALDSNPIWSPNGRQVLFQSGSSTIYSRTVNDAAPEQLVLNRPEMIYPLDVSADGRTLLYARSTGPPLDLMFVSLVGDRTPHPFVQTMFDERDGQFSPDGKWVAYQSNESGRYEVYLQPFPGPGDRIQVSAGGGQQVRWGHQGSELFYVAVDQRLTSVPLAFAANGAVNLGRPVPLFRTEFDTNLLARQQYVVSVDGQRLLVNAPTDAINPLSITLILNWNGQP